VKSEVVNRLAEYWRARSRWYALNQLAAQYDRTRGCSGIHRIIAYLPVVAQRVERSFLYQTVAIFRLVEILGLVEADRCDQFRRSEISAIEIGADDRDAGQVGAAASWNASVLFCRAKP
jgi:hypothetical protein